MEDNAETTEYETATEQLDSEIQHIPVKSQLAVLAVIMLLIFGSTVLPKAFSALDATEENAASVSDTTVLKTLSEEVEPVDFFENISIYAQSAFVWDVQSQRVLYQKKPDLQLPLASVTKLMTALLAYEILEGDTKISIDLSAIKQDGNSGLLDGETFTLKDLMGLTLQSSSNDGAYAIASAAGKLLSSENGVNAFVEAMNIRTSELGLTQTYFRNPTGLDLSTKEGGAYGSARDMTFLMQHILTTYPQILELTREKNSNIVNGDGAVHTYENTNPSIDKIDGLIGSKTGYTELAGGNLVIAFDAAFNRPMVVVVLNSTYRGRFNDVSALSEAARNTIQQ